MEKQSVNTVFDYRALRLLMGLVAFLLPIIVSIVSIAPLTSISASYYSEARDLFVGLLFVVGSFLFAYNGHSKFELWVSKVASLAAIFVASFPTNCDDCSLSIVSYIHYISAAVLFSILAYFCFMPFQKGTKGIKGKKGRRSLIYLICGSTMLGCMVGIFLAYIVLPEELLNRLRITFFGEAIALVAFGVAWVVSGKSFRLIADDDEMYHMFRNSDSGGIKIQAPNQ